MVATVTIGTSSFSAARNQAMRLNPFDDGGEDAQDTMSVLCKTSDVVLVAASPRTLIGTLATIDGQQWRIADLTQGAAGTTITVQSVDK